MPIDLFGDQAGDPFAAPRRKPRTLTPEEETSSLGRLLEGSLGGLAYLGKLADKTFGARAVRGGLLGGNPRELLSVLPLSDTLGLTNESDVVHGTDLLANAGLTTKGDTSLENEIAGFGVDVATDPSLLVGAAIPKAVLGATGKAAAAGGRAAGSAVQAATGGRVNPFTFGARKAGEAKVLGRALFDTDVAGATSKYGQGLAESEFTPRLRAGREQADQNFAAGLDPLDAYAKRLAEPQRYDLNAALTQAAEGYRPAAEARLGGLGFAPPEVNDILTIGNLTAAQTRATLGTERATGVVSKEATDVPEWAAVANKAARDAGLPEPFQGFNTEYFPRTAAAPDGQAGRSLGGRLSGVGQFQEARNTAFRGVPGGTLGVEGLVKDANLSGANRAFTDLQVEDHLTHMLTGYGSGQIPAAWVGTPWGQAAWDGAKAQARELSQYLHGLPEKTTRDGLFNLDFLGNARARQADSARVVASGETMVRGLSEQARPIAQLQAAGVQAVPLTEALQRSGLTHVDPATGVPVGADRIAAALGLKVDDLRHMAVPADVFADMSRMGQAWRVPESVAPVVDLWDRVSNLFKGGLTSPFPAFHVRNAVSGLFNMWRAGTLSWGAATDMLRVQRGGSLSDATVAKLFPGMAADEATRRFREMLVGSNISFTRSGMVGERIGPVEPVTRRGLLPGDLPEVGGAVRPLRGDVGQFLGGFVPEKGKLGQQLNPFDTLTRPVGEGSRSEFLPVRQGERLGNTVEDWIRGSHFLGGMLGGLTPAEAKLSTMKYQIDYADLTQFEQNVMKRLFPWYTFSRKNLPPLLEDLATQPAKVTTALRAASGIRQPGEFVPPYVAEGASLPVPGAPEGQQRYISSFGLPFEDEAVKLLGSAAQGDLQRVAQQVFGMAQPFVKLPAEVATGTQMYSGRKLTDLQPYEFAGLGGLVPENAARQASQVIANTPASRVASTVDKFIDERKGLGPTLLNTLTGVRAQDVDLERVKDPVARKVLIDMLRGEPGVKVREDVSVPNDKLATLSPDDLMTYDLLREVERRQAERARLSKARQKE